MWRKLKPLSEYKTGLYPHNRWGDDIPEETSWRLEMPGLYSYIPTGRWRRTICEGPLLPDGNYVEGVLR